MEGIELNSGTAMLVAMFVLTIGCQHSKCSTPFFPVVFFDCFLFLLPQVRIGDSQKVIVFQVWSAYESP